MWNERYADPEFAYGTAPNDFLREVGPSLHGPVLCLASGEGRNAVWLAEQGLEVHGVDISSEGVAKTHRLAEQRGVTVHAHVGDLSEYDLGDSRWGAIVGIFAHLPPAVRERVHRAIPTALKPGGQLVLEMYTPRQLAFGTGGPPVEPMLYTEELVRSHMPQLHYDRLAEVEREVVEGKYHTGRAAVLQVLATRPSQSQ